MTYKDSNPTFNTGNRKIVNYKDFLQGEPQEEQELKDMKRKFKKNELEVGNQEHMSKYNKVTHKNDDLVKAEVQDKLDALEEAKKDKYKKGTKPEKTFDPSKNAKDFLEDLARKMGVSKEEAMERLEKLAEMQKKSEIKEGIFSDRYELGEYKFEVVVKCEQRISEGDMENALSELENLFGAEVEVREIK
jgi:hypothetical protein